MNGTVLLVHTLIVTDFLLESIINIMFNKHGLNDNPERTISTVQL